MLQAARLGYEGKLDLPPIETGDGFDKTDAKQGVAANLRQAAKDLQADTVLAEAVGPELVAHQVFMKEREYRKTRDMEPNAVLDFYVWFI